MNLAAAAMPLLGAAAANVEYSIDHRPGVHGITVPLRGAIHAELGRVAAAAGFPGTWLSTVSRLLDAMLPDTVLLRIDTDGLRIGALTAYLRFTREPEAATLQALLAAASRLAAQPAPLAALAQALRCPGARGLGVRTGVDGAERLSVYFRVERDLQSFGADTVRDLADVFGWPGAHCAELAQALRALHPGGSVGVIGTDLDAGGAPQTLKCDPANVPLARALPFLLAHGADMERCLALCRTLRARTLSYLGVKYDATGFAGWRAYFSCRPHGPSRNGQPALLTDTRGSAAQRMPHY